MKTINDIKVILVEKGTKYSADSKQFLSLKKTELLNYNTEEELAKHIECLKNEGYRSKEVLILKSFRGRFFQKCPGSPGVICCNYYLVNTCFNCLYNCAYCFLNSYLNAFGVVFFTNWVEIFNEIDTFLQKANEDIIYRIGTGEFTDSLMIDDWSKIGKKIIERFSLYKNVMIELKTKSNNIDHLLEIKKKGNAVLSWSLNTPRNVDKYEEDTSSIENRINSAARASNAGYFIAFHFDPIILYEGWKNDYKTIIKRLFEKVDPEKIVWISMGGFRYSPGFKERIQDVFPEEEMTIEEMFPGIDGKFRYLKNKRVDIYKTIKGYINFFTEKPFLYLCMETDDVWQSVFDREYKSSENLEMDFSKYLKRKI